MEKEFKQLVMKLQLFSNISDDLLIAKYKMVELQMF